MKIFFHSTVEFSHFYLSFIVKFHEIYLRDAHILPNLFYLNHWLFASCWYLFHSFALGWHQGNFHNLRFLTLVVYGFHSDENETKILQCETILLYLEHLANLIIRVLNLADQIALNHCIIWTLYHTVVVNPLWYPHHKNVNFRKRNCEH